MPEVLLAICMEVLLPVRMNVALIGMDIPVVITQVGSIACQVLTIRVDVGFVASHISPVG